MKKKNDTRDYCPRKSYTNGLNNDGKQAWGYTNAVCPEKEIDFEFRTVDKGELSEESAWSNDPRRQTSGTII